jgi:hypothetical protein
MIIALAFVIRRWEDEAVREIDESDLTEKAGEDSARTESAPGVSHFVQLFPHLRPGLNHQRNRFSLRWNRFD